MPDLNQNGGGTVSGRMESVPHLYLTITVTRGGDTKIGGWPYREGGAGRRRCGQGAHGNQGLMAQMTQ